MSTAVLQNVESCEYQVDMDCIDKCRDQFGDNLPNVCTECNLNRPVLFVSSADLDQTLILTTALEEITTERLGGVARAGLRLSVTDV